jgi:transposase
MIRQFKDPRQYRLELVRYAKEHGVKPAARYFKTTPKTIRKWLRRWNPGSLEGLADQSRAPKNPKIYITQEQKEQVNQLKRMLPSFGAERIKQLYQLTISEKTIRTIWRKQGLLKTKRKKHKTKQNLREIKAKWKSFEQISIDTKDLIDIPEYWPQIRNVKLPKVQYTARDVTSGTQFIAYADERSLCYSTLFVDIILKHLKACQVYFNHSRVQTDNGSEFIGNWNAKEDSSFTKTVHSFKDITHTTIPPSAHTWQSDVETVHRIIEDEFYEVETFHDRKEFLNKATSYILWFNIARKNSYKENKTPWEIIKEKNPNADPAIPLLPPVFLDKLYFKKPHNQLPGGYHVGPDP